MSNELGEMLAQARVRKRVKVQEVADAIGKSVSEYSKVEAGRMKPWKVADNQALYDLLGAVLGIPSSELKSAARRDNGDREWAEPPQGVTLEQVDHVAIPLGSEGAQLVFSYEDGEAMATLSRAEGVVWSESASEDGGVGLIHAWASSCDPIDRGVCRMTLRSSPSSGFDVMVDGMVGWLPVSHVRRAQVRRWCEYVLADMAERAKGDEPEATESDEPPSADHPNSFFPVQHDFRVWAGHHIDDVVSAMMTTADALGSYVETSHAGVTFGANPGDPTELVKSRWRIAQLEKDRARDDAARASYTATPEPDPTPSTGDVWAEVIADEPPGHARDAMVARRQMGIDKYGMPLQRNNGRDVRNDMLDEALDLLTYARCGRNAVVESIARAAVCALVATDNTTP